MPITIPEWLQAPDAGADYARGLQIGSQVAEANARLSQQAQEAQMHAAIASRQAQQEHDLQQQRIAVTAAYHQEQAQLGKQRLEEVKAANDQRTANAARQYQAKQQWQRAAQAIDSDTNLNDQQKDDAKTRAIMQLAPLMGTAGTEASAMLRDLRPPKATVPASIDTESNPDFDIVHQPTGAIQLHPKPKPAKESPVKVRLDGATVVEMSQDQAKKTIANLPDDMKADPVNKAVMTSDVPRGTGAYQTQDDVVKDFKAGKISRSDAKKLLTNQFGVKE